MITGTDFMNGWQGYQRVATAEMRHWHPGLDMTGVSVSEADFHAGSPKNGDMIARNPDNHNDQWLVAFEYYQKNFVEL